MRPSRASRKSCSSRLRRNTPPPVTSKARSTTCHAWFTAKCLAAMILTGQSAPWSTPSVQSSQVFPRWASMAARRHLGRRDPRLRQAGAAQPHLPSARSPRRRRREAGAHRERLPVVAHGRGARRGRSPPARRCGPGAAPLRPGRGGRAPGGRARPVTRQPARRVPRDRRSDRRGPATQRTSGRPGGRPPVGPPRLRGDGRARPYISRSSATVARRSSHWEPGSGPGRRCSALRRRSPAAVSWTRSGISPGRSVWSRSSGRLEHWRLAGNWTELWATLRNLALLLAREGRGPAALLLAAADAAPDAPAVAGPHAAELAAARDRLRSELGDADLETLEDRSRTLARPDVLEVAFGAISAGASAT